jgi:hypothetical protein
MTPHYKELLVACHAADRDWSASGSVSADTMSQIRAALGKQENIVEKSFALVEKMRKTLEGV